MSENLRMVGESKVSVIHHNIIYVNAIGEQTYELALEHKEVIFKFSEAIQGQINLLIDLNQCGKNSSEARLIWKELSEHKNTHRVAIFGLHPVARVSASFVMGITNKNNQKFFSTKEQSIAWLLNQTEK